MAEQDNSQEKTEEATPRRLEKAREEGQIPRSKELNTTAVLLAGAGGLLAMGTFLGGQMLDMMRYSFELDRNAAFDTSQMFAHLGMAFVDAFWGLAPLLVILLIASIVGPIGLGGWMISAKALAPKFSRMDPIKGMGRMFSIKALVELLKSVAKVTVIAALAIMLLFFMQQDLQSLGREPLPRAIEHAMWIIAWSALALCASTILIAVVDIPFQIWEHARQLKMTRQEVKDEMKDVEGKPEVKGKVRQLQREMANRRMMSAVPEADVVITNPTHYAVALRYDPDTMETPVLLAKGVDQIALKIREVAKEYQVEVVESPVLARAVYHTTEIDQDIPAGLYLAVAQVLAYVFQLRHWRRGQGERPRKPTNLNVPPHMRYND